MAPTVRSSSSAGVGNTGAASPAKPAGLAVGDLMIAFQLCDADGLLTSMTAPAGFVEIDAEPPVDPDQVPGLKIWRKVATSGDVAASSFAFPDDDGSHASVVLVAITAGTYDEANPTGTPTMATQANAPNASMVAPSVAGETDALLLCGFGADTGGTVRTFTTPHPTGMTLIEQSAQGTSQWTRFAAYSEVLSSTVSTGTRTATLSGTPDGWTTTSLIVLPAGGSGGGDTTETFGNIADGGVDTTSSSTTKISISSAVAPSPGGILQTGHAHVWVSGGSSNTRLVVYADNGASAPGARLAVSDELAITETTEGQRDYTFSGSNQIEIVPGATYWLGIMWSDPGTPNVVHSRGGVSNSRWERSASAAPTWTYPNAPDPFGTTEGPFTGPTEVWVDYLVPGGPEGGRFMIATA